MHSVISNAIIPSEFERKLTASARKGPLPCTNPEKYNTTNQIKLQQVA